MKYLPLMPLLFWAITSSFASDYTGGDIHASDYKWMNANLFRGHNQHGGFRKFNDTYLELEFGGRSGVLDFYGYMDFIDIFNDKKNSDQHLGDNSFTKFDARFSLDAIFNKDLALGNIKEWYFATEMMNADSGNFGGLRVYWLGLGTDTLIPWLGLTGINLQTRYFAENYGASNEGKIDGYVLHMNWFKPLVNFEQHELIAFQGYLDYEFASNIEGSNRSPTSFQTYLGFWYHLKQYAFGYGAKIYQNMNNFRDGENMPSSSVKVNSSGVGHYFNVTYKF